jgi:hypothetical protein
MSRGFTEDVCVLVTLQRIAQFIETSEYGRIVGKLDQ